MQITVGLMQNVDRVAEESAVFTTTLMASSEMDNLREW